MKPYKTEKIQLIVTVEITYTDAKTKREAVKLAKRCVTSTSILGLTSIEPKKAKLITNKNEKKNRLLAEVNEVLDFNDYIFRNREDFVESRTDWGRLAEISEAFYWKLHTIKDALQSDEITSNE